MFSAWYDRVVMETGELGDELEMAFAWEEPERRRKERRLHACRLTREHGTRCVFVLADVLERKRWALSPGPLTWSICVPRVLLMLRWVGMVHA